MRDFLYLLALLIFSIFPVILALRWGDRLAEAWDRRRLRRRHARRSRIPLPQGLLGQDDLLAGLKATESRREELDLQISEKLLNLQRLTVSAWKQRRPGSASDLLRPAETLENLYAGKERALDLLLDLACLQSDRIDAMTAEVDALSRGLGRSPAASPPEDVPPQRDVPAQVRAPETAADQLLRRIEEAARKRRTIDERLKQMKSWKPPRRDTPLKSPPPDPEAGQKGSRFDMTVQ